MKRMIVGSLEVMSIGFVVLFILIGLIAGWQAGGFGGAIVGLIVSFAISIVIFGALFILLEINNNVRSLREMVESRSEVSPKV